MWFKVDDGLWGHPKWLALAGKPRARSLWVTAGSWCSANLTDGHVPAHVLVAFGARTADATALVTAGLWVVTGEGWRFHDWDDFQPSRTEVEDQRRKRSEAGRKGGLRSGQTRRGRSKSEASASGLLEAQLNPGPARTRTQTPLLTLAGRLTEVDARDLAAGLPEHLIVEWQGIAGPGVDLEAEARAYLARHGDTTPRDPRAAWLGWLRRARPAAPPPPEPCRNAECRGGWLPDDSTGRAVPCPACRPHLRPVPTDPTTRETA